MNYYLTKSWLRGEVVSGVTRVGRDCGGEIERRRLVTREKVRVARERERGRVVAEHAAELEEVGPSA